MKNPHDYGQTAQNKADLQMLMTDVKFRRFIGTVLDEFPPMKKPSYNGSENFVLDGRAVAGQWILEQLVKSGAPETTGVYAEFLKRKLLTGEANA